MKNKKQTEKNLKEIEDCLRYMVDEGFVKKVEDRFYLKTEKEIEEEIENVRKDS